MENNEFAPVRTETNSSEPPKENEIGVEEARVILGLEHPQYVRKVAHLIDGRKVKSSNSPDRWVFPKDKVEFFAKQLELKRTAEKRTKEAKDVINNIDYVNRSEPQSTEVNRSEQKRTEANQIQNNRYISFLETELAETKKDLKTEREKGTAAIEKAARLEGEQTGRDMIIGEYQKLIFSLTEKLRIAPTGDRGQPKIVEMEREEIKEI